MTLRGAMGDHGRGVPTERRAWLVRRGLLGFEAIIARLDAHFYGPSPTTSTTGPRWVKTGEILAVSGNWLDAFVDHLGKKRRRVGAERGVKTWSWLLLPPQIQIHSLRDQIDDFEFI